MIVPFMVMESEEDYGDAKPTPVIELIGLVKNGNQAWKIDSENVSGAGQAAISKAVASLKGTKTFELPDQDSKKLGAAITKGRKVKDSMFPKWMKNIEPKMVEKLGMI